ncbi:hypothetical protein ASD15_08980 [Massilia sp. Root351]|jgi:7-keto-8-aminopelargonate synthetase-like enzyme|uniref:aminotransferase class I/II-fold pyridoxal phosphate-dependent enzyme n=1 Tax=Massilia sp. Root351 TaxID=1736522 RepID=UPI000712A0DA|nr:pyridoxal phosphate-dependent aminotransferase family protein [Massilia sp. Root351]KQV82190.1 hypothetical protein ASD15_08980 [Massilia sp. Root351]
MNHGHQGAMLRQVQSPSCARVTVDGRELLNFGGSGYLGLDGNPFLAEEGAAALRKYGVHSQLGRHYGFASVPNLDAETAARDYFAVDGAMYFGTGYLFGLIAIPALAEVCDTIFIDEAAHYSLRDGAQASGKPVHHFAHRDADSLARLLARKLATGQRPLIATDGMFPTFGTVAPLAQLARLARRHDGWLAVDESHAFGTLGANGRGAVEACGVPRERVVAGGSMAKAFAAHGGIAVGPAGMMERLWRMPAARGAALGSSAGAAMSAASLRLVRRQPELRARLLANSRQLKRGLRELGQAIDDNDSPVAAFVPGNAAHMRGIQARLMEQGIFITYSNYVGAGPEGALRIAAFADHSEDDIQRLLSALGRLLLGAPARLGSLAGRQA